MLVNVLVSLSNLVALPFVTYLNSVGDRSLMLFAMCCSIMMHLSETKHGLPGIYPFNLLSFWFLQLDRAMCFLVIIVLCFRSSLYIVDRCMIVEAIFGLTCMFLSEKVVRSQWTFAAFHVMWHYVAFHLMYILLLK
jgi:hypothetical protein